MKFGLPELTVFQPQLKRKLFVPGSVIEMENVLSLARPILYLRLVCGLDLKRPMYSRVDAKASGPSLVIDAG